MRWENGSIAAAAPQEGSVRVNSAGPGTGPLFSGGTAETRRGEWRTGLRVGREGKPERQLSFPVPSWGFCLGV